MKFLRNSLNIYKSTQFLLLISNMILFFNKYVVFVNRTEVHNGPKCIKAYPEHNASLDALHDRDDQPCSIDLIDFNETLPICSLK